MADEQEVTGRCGWIALSFVVLLLLGILPGSLIGGLAGLKTAEVFGCSGGSELIGRLFVLAGMILGLLLSTIILVFLTMAVRRMALVLLKRSSRVASRGRFDLEE